MQDIISKLKKHWLIVLSVGGIAIIGILLFSLQQNKSQLVTTLPSATPKATPPPAVVADWGELDKIVAGFGTPIKTSKEPNRTDEFNTKSVNRKTSVVYQENVPVFAKEVVTAKDTMSISTIQQKYGDPAVTLFSPASADTDIYLYAYPQKGIAYQANSTSGILYEVWYFRPMTEKELEQTWAKDFSTSPQSGTF